MQQNLLDEKNGMMEWDKCFEYRQAKMSDYKDFNEIFNDWSYLTQLKGCSLVCQ